MASAEPEDSALGQPQGARIPVDDPNALLQGDVSGISGPPSPPSGGEESERTRSADGDASASTRPPNGSALRLVQDAADEARCSTRLHGADDDDYRFPRGARIYC